MRQQVEQSALKIDANPLGIQNPLQPHGRALLIYAGGLVCLLLIALLVPTKIVMGLIAGAVFCGAVAIRGLTALLQPLTLPHDVPGDIQLPPSKQLRDVVNELPRDVTYFGTYQEPQGLIQLLTHLAFPLFTYMTPPVRLLYSWIPRRAFLCVLILVLWVVLLSSKLDQVAWDGIRFPMIWLTIFAFVALGLQIAGALQVKVDRPRKPEHLVEHNRLLEAGQPSSLFAFMKNRAFTQIFERGMKHRIFFDRTNAVGARAETDSYQGEILVETQPVPVPVPPSTRQGATFLELGGVALGLLGWLPALFQFSAAMFPGALVIVGGLSVAFSWQMLWIAYCQRATFRFRSDLFWLWIEGTFQRQRMESDELGFGSLERMRSDLHYRLIGTRIITEASVYNVRPQIVFAGADFWATIQDVKRALAGPRRLVDSQLDDEIRERMLFLKGQLESYRDTGGEVLGVNLQGKGAQEMMQAKMLKEAMKARMESEVRLQEMARLKVMEKVLQGMDPAQAQQLLAQMGAGSNPAALLGQAPVPAPMPVQPPPLPQVYSQPPPLPQVYSQPPPMGQGYQPPPAPRPQGHPPQPPPLGQAYPPQPAAPTPQGYPPRPAAPMPPVVAGQGTGGVSEQVCNLLREAIRNYYRTRHPQARDFIMQIVQTHAIPPQVAQQIDAQVRAEFTRPG